MKKILLLSILALAFVFVAILWNESFIPAIKTEAITSPLPEFLTKKVPTIFGDKAGFFRPSRQVIEKIGLAKPTLTAQSALAYDLADNKFIYRKDIKRKLPMASLTKITTAIVALENMDIKKKFKVSDSASKIGEDSMGLSQDEVLSLGDLLYGLMLPSGNDAAEVIARGSNSGRDNFLHLMNREAESLGLSDTRFTNPTGLEGDGNQYTTAYDLLILTEYALRNPIFAKIVSTYEYDIPQTSEHKNYLLYNETNLLTSYPGVKGVKTGYTEEAGLCLVSYLEYGGHRIIAVLLNAQNRRQEMKDLLDYSLKALDVKPPPHG